MPYLSPPKAIEGIKGIYLLINVILSKQDIILL